jgi:hypothetical protein
MKYMYVACFAVVTVACEGGFEGPGQPIGGDILNPSGPSGGPQNPANPSVMTCATGRQYLGLGGTDLALSREIGPVGAETRRPKPFSALLTEYPRVLGSAPASLASAEATFGTVPVRWSMEPSISAVALYTAFRVAFQGCLAQTAQPAKYATAPTMPTAQAECAEWAQRFWSRNATPAQVDSCAEVAVRDAANEANPRRKWAYACAATLTSAEFLTF